MQGRTCFTIKMFGNAEVDDRVLSRKWLIVNGEVAYMRITSCTNFVKLRNVGRHLYKITVSYIRAVIRRNLVLGGHSPLN
jgi:hypothetical protein